MRLVHVFSAEVALGDKGEVVVQAGEPAIALCGLFRLVGTLGQGLPVIDPGIALEHFEARAYFMDAVVQRFELGGLVDHIFRRRHFAAIVQP
ncbi:hypothetical protein D3C85_857970 [compost metagenome]